MPPCGPAGARPSGRVSARRRSPPTCVCATSATPPSCSPPPTRSRSTPPSSRSRTSWSASREWCSHGRAREASAKNASHFPRVWRGRRRVPGRRRRLGETWFPPLAGVSSMDAGRVGRVSTELLHSAVYWAIGKGVIGGVTRTMVPLTSYGRDRVPREGGGVLAMNHFSYVDPPVFGVSCPRRIVFMAKIELHRAPGLGQLIRSHGTISVRRGESDREALR